VTSHHESKHLKEISHANHIPATSWETIMGNTSTKRVLMPNKGQKCAEKKEKQDRNLEIFFSNSNSLNSHQHTNNQKGVVKIFISLLSPLQTSNF